MFKNAFVFRISWPSTLATWDLDQLLDSQSFAACGPTQEQSVGWVPPRGEAHGGLVESINSELVLKLMIETKSVPASVIDKQTQARCVEIESKTGRKPGKKEIKEIKEEVKFSLLPTAFAKQSSALVWISRDAGLLVIDASSQGIADLVCTTLVQAVGPLSVRPLTTTTSPATAMSQWLRTQEAPEHMSIDFSCELKAQDESKAVVRYANHALDIEEVQQHITGGKIPTKLAMTWKGRVSFVLTDTLQLKKLTFPDGVLDAAAEQPADDRFDADMAIFCGEMGGLIPDLIEALDGEIELDAS